MSGLHAAIIMDGNGRWAVARGKSRTAGHLAGADAVRRTVEGAPGHGIDILTLYAFSSDNWRRPPEEVGALMRLLRRYLMAETGRCVENGVRIQVIGRRDRLASSLVREIESAERATSRGQKLWLRIAIDYSARDAILRAAWRLSAGQPPGDPGSPGSPGSHGAPISREEFSRLVAECPEQRAHDVDLLIRTGGEKRLSDFLLWECAYAELIFTERMWPDFGAADLEDAVLEFRHRERRFGTVPAAAAAARSAAAGSAAPATPATIAITGVRDGGRAHPDAEIAALAMP
ncbi:MAG TPA: di-trans,poly-cis-decaprenylcistransferase [Thermoanaerobaculia bacterium]|nr:di-trans,poly-cis-decaprenylcistransferase [Thermoanaerobaculia bacterium]